MKQQQVMVMQPDRAMVAFGEVPVLETTDVSHGFICATEVMNYLRCGCPGVQLNFHDENKYRQEKFMDGIKVGLERLCLQGESVDFKITMIDDHGIVILITRQVQPKKS